MKKKWEYRYVKGSMKFVCNAKKVRLFHCKSKVFVFFRILKAPKTHENVIVTVSTTYLFSMFFQNNKIPFKNVNKALIFFRKTRKSSFFMLQKKLSDALTYRYSHFF